MIRKALLGSLAALVVGLVILGATQFYKQQGDQDRAEADRRTANELGSPTTVSPPAPHGIAKAGSPAEPAAKANGRTSAEPPATADVQAPAQPHSTAKTNPPLTLAQKQKLRERDRWSEESSKFEQAGKLEDAIEAANKMLAIEREVFGEVHEDIVGSFERLAGIHEKRLDFVAARKAREQVLAMRKKLLGKQHWQTTDARLALDRAELLTRLTPGQRARLAEAAQMSSHGAELSSQGKNEDAARQEAQVAAIRKEILGERDVLYAESLRNLGIIYHQMKDYDKAETQHRQGLEVFKNAVGEVHPEIARSLNFLGRVYFARGDYANAEPLYRQSADISRKTLGDTDAFHNGTLGALVEIYDATKQPAKAEAVRNELLRNLKKESSGPTPDSSRPALIYQQGNQEFIQDVAISPDSRWTVSADGSGSLILWDLDTGRVLRRFLGNNGPVNCVRISKDGQWLLVGTRFTGALLWDLATGKMLRRLPLPALAWGFEISSDGSRVVALAGHKNPTDRRTQSTRFLYVLDVATARVLWQSKDNDLIMRLIALTPDEKVLAESEDQTIRAWDMKTGTELFRISGYSGNGPVAISADGRRLLFGSADKTLRLVELATGKEVLRLACKSEATGAALISTDGLWAAVACEDASVRLWDLVTGKETHQLRGHALQPVKRKFLPPKPRDGVDFLPLPPGRRPLGVREIAWSRDGRWLVTTGDDGTIRVWEAATGKEVGQLKGYSESLSRLTISRDSRWVLAAGNEGTIYQWKLGEDKEPRRLQGQSDQIASLSLSRDGRRFVTGAYGGSISLWDMTRGTELRRFKLDSLRTPMVALSADGRWLAGSGFADRSVRIWEVATGKEVGPILAGPSGVCSLALSADGRFVLVGIMEGGAILWDRKTNNEVRRFSGFAQNPSLLTVTTGTGDRQITIEQWRTSVALSADGRFVAAAQIKSKGLAPGVMVPEAAKEIVLWEVATGKEKHRFTGSAVALSDDGGRAATISGNAITVWDLATGKPIGTRQYPCLGLQSVALSHDGKWAVVGSSETFAALWQVGTANQVFLTGHSNWVKGVAISGDHHWVVTCSTDSSPRLWDALTGKEMCSLVSFSNKDWAVIDPEGRYDASNGGDVEGLHWVVANEPIALQQLKERYYDPGLLAKYFGFKKEPIRAVEAFRNVDLYPEAMVTDSKPGDKRLTFDLTNCGGGIGRVQVFVNRKELLSDARGPSPNPDAAKTTVTIDLSDAPLIPNQRNSIKIVTWNAEGYLSSRGMKREIDGPSEIPVPPKLYAVVAGVSTYGHPSLNLRFAAKDADNFATALELGAKRLFGTEKVQVTLLSSAEDPKLRPTKENLAKAFADLKKVKPSDVLVVYLAGHGVALQRGTDLYCYLTADARSSDPATLADSAVRAATTVSSEELAEWIKQIPALKQVMVLDTCSAGAAAVKLTEKRDVSSDQIRAIERLKDRTGFHVLMGCAADRVSYEATQYSQGLLTYSLLQGMRGAALRDERFVDVSKLFQYSADQVPQLAQYIGGVQRPVVAAPRGSSFDIGQLESGDKAAIPLALVRPLVLRPVLLNSAEAEDDLKLTPLLRQRLSDASQFIARGKQPVIVYLPEDEFPGAVRPTGTYAVEADNVTVQLRLKRDGGDVARLTVVGSKRDLAALAEKLTSAILGALK